MRVLISETHRYIYHMNPKVGSNTTLNMLYRLAGMRDEIIGNPHQVSRDLPLLDRHGLIAADVAHGDCQAFFKNWPGYFTFSFTRNPYTRLKSAYNDKLKRYAEIAEAALVEKLGQGDGDKSKKYFQRELKARISFEQFAKGVCGDHLYGDQHWVPQYDRLRPDLCKYDSLGKLENYRADLSSILNAIGIAPENHPSFPSRLNSAPDPRQNSDYYNEDLIRLVLKTYDKDFAEFGYDEKLPK